MADTPEENPKRTPEKLKEDDVVSSSVKTFDIYLKENKWSMEDKLGNKPSTFQVEKRFGLWTVIVTSLDSTKPETLEVTLNADTINTVMAAGEIGGERYRLLYTLATDYLEQIVGNPNAIVKSDSLANTSPEIQGDNGITVENRLFLTGLYATIRAAKLVTDNFQNKGDNV